MEPDLSTLRPKATGQCQQARGPPCAAPPAQAPGPHFSLPFMTDPKNTAIALFSQTTQQAELPPHSTTKHADSLTPPVSPVSLSATSLLGTLSRASLHLTQRMYTFGLNRVPSYTRHTRGVFAIRKYGAKFYQLLAVFPGNQADGHAQVPVGTELQESPHPRCLAPPSTCPYQPATSCPGLSRVTELRGPGGSHALRDL